MDAFFASCMQLKYPYLRNKPIVVAYKDKSSIIVTSSYEARKLGVKTGMPLYCAYKQTNNAIIQVDPEYSLFSTYSEQVFSIIYNEFSKQLEVASIDECYIDVTNEWQRYGTPKKMAIAIKNRINEVLGLTCSIGISDNKFLAKVVGKVNKPNGVTVANPKNIKNILWDKNVDDIHGIGKALSKKMHKLDINTVKDLALSDDDFLLKNFGRYGLELKRNVNGFGSDVVLTKHNDYKNISNEVTLSNPIYNEEEFLELIHNLTIHVANRASQRKMVAKTLAISVHYAWKGDMGEDFDQIKHHKRESHQIKTEEYTADSEVMYAYLNQLALEKIDVSKGIKLVSVGMRNTIRRELIPYQFSFMDNDSDNLSNYFSLQTQHKIKRAKDIEAAHGKLSGQTKYIKKDEIHFSPKAKK